MSDKRPNPRPRAARRDPEGGYVLLYAVLGLVLIFGLVLSSADRDEALHNLVESAFDVEGHARQAAESGIVDALAWLRRQEEQPVVEFAPERDLESDPPIDDTDEPDIGLVREYEIAKGYWARYEVRVPTVAESFTDSNANGVFDDGEAFDDQDGNGIRSQAHGCQDVSLDRGAYSDGIIWYLQCAGSIFTRPERERPLGEGRNHRLAHVVLGTEVRRLAYILPASAAIVVGDADETEIEGAYINSPILGIAHRPNTGKPDYKTKEKDKKRVEFDAPAEHAAVPGWVSTSGIKNDHDIRCQDVFGVSIETLKSMADFNVGTVTEIPKRKSKKSKKSKKKEGDPIERLPVTLPEDSFVVITPEDGDEVVFDETESLIGRGIVVIDGDLLVTESTMTDFSGILYVTGDVHIEKAGVFEGIFICGGELTVEGQLPYEKKKTSGKSRKSKKSHKTHKSKKTKKSVKIKPDWSVWFEHDPELVSLLARKVGNYRRWKASFRPAPRMEDGRPDETLVRR